MSLSNDISFQNIKEKITNGEIKKIIVMTGAGISVSAGIPDFRSPKTGLYHKLARYNLPAPESIFTLSYFRRNPDAFNDLVRDMFPGKYKPTVTHRFIKMLEDKGLLLRNYTQNIDDLERLAGISAEKLIQAHGTFSSAHCIDCGRETHIDEYKDEIFSGATPTCKHLIPSFEKMGRFPPIQTLDVPFSKPSAPTPDSREVCGGFVKPDIVFFGEDLPERFHIGVMEDFKDADLLIVMGSSLQVGPFNMLIGMVPESCPRILINLTPVAVKPRVNGPSQNFKLRQMKRFRNEENPESDSELEMQEVEKDREAFYKKQEELNAKMALVFQKELDEGYVRTSAAEIREEARRKVIWPHFTEKYSKLLPLLDQMEEAESVLATDPMNKEANELLRTTLFELEELEHSVSSATSYEYHGFGSMREIGFTFWHRDNKRDLCLIDDCDAGCKALAELLGWKDDFEDMLKIGEEIA